MRKEQLHDGQDVIADEQIVGHLLGTREADHETYLHVRRFAPVVDDLYIPIGAVDRIDADRIYLSLRFGALAGEAWHMPPAGGESAA